MIADGADLLRFWEALLVGGLTSAAALEEMQAAVPATDTGAYGLGLVALELPCGLTVWGHGGADLGWHTLTFSSRDGQRRIVLSVNAFPTPPEVFEEAREVVATEFCGLPGEEH